MTRQGLAFSIILALSGFCSPVAAEAQQAAKVSRIGFLATSLAATSVPVEAFRQGLRDLGYVEGRNVVIEYRDAEGKFERYPALAAELVALKKPGRPLVPARRTGRPITAVSMSTW